MQVIGGLVAIVVIVALVFGGVMMVGDWLDQTQIEKDQARAAVEWARAAQINAQTNMNAQREADWRMNLMTFTTVMKLSGASESAYLILGLIAGLLGIPVGKVVYDKSVSTGS